VVEPVARRAAPLIAQAAQARGVAGVAGQHRAAFAGSDLLVGIEAEDGERAECAHAARIRGFTELRADRFAGVFHDDQIVPAGDRLECVHVGGDAEGVDDEQGARAWGDGLLDGGGIEVEGDRVDLREDRRCADLEHRVGDGYKSEGGNDDLIARANAQREQG